jgi:hypothetical protein
LAERGEISAHDLSVLAGILADKTGAGTGSAALVVEHRHTHRVTVGAGAQVWAELGSTGGSSVVNAAECAQIVDALPVGSGSGSGSDGSKGPDLAPGLLAADLEHGAGSAAGDQGGGVSFSPAADNPDTSSDAKIQAKAPLEDSST